MQRTVFQLQPDEMQRIAIEAAADEIAFWKEHAIIGRASWRTHPDAPKESDLRAARVELEHKRNAERAQKRRV